MSRTYVIVDSSEAVNFNFAQLVDIDESYSRKSLDGSKILARYEGEQPSFLNGKQEYTHSEILAILATEEWTSDQPI
jgi:hypothetical protein